MRQILFRGKSINNGNWVYGAYSTDYPDTNRHMIIGHDIDGEYGGLLYETVDPDTVSQCTGLVDKNRKQIYEGDILREDKSFFTVVYDQNWAKFRLQHDEHAIQYPEWNRGMLMEIVGNIYDD